jgi:hypothetical protein
MRVPRIVVTGAVAVLIAAGGLSACASSGMGASAGGAGSSSPPTSPAGLSPTGSTPTSSVGPPAVGATVTVSGTLIQGAEPSCLILKSDRGELELLSNKGDAHAGQHVVATGHVVRVMSHCMQGQPFEVDTLTVG